MDGPLGDFGILEIVTLFSSSGRKTAKEMQDDETAAVHPRGRKEEWRRIMEEGEK